MEKVAVHDKVVTTILRNKKTILHKGLKEGKTPKDWKISILCHKAKEMRQFQRN